VIYLVIICALLSDYMKICYSRPTVLSSRPGLPYCLVDQSLDINHLMNEGQVRIVIGLTFCRLFYSGPFKIYDNHLRAILFAM